MFQISDPRRLPPPRACTEGLHVPDKHALLKVAIVVLHVAPPVRADGRDAARIPSVPAPPPRGHARADCVERLRASLSAATVGRGRQRRCPFDSSGWQQSS